MARGAGRVHLFDNIRFLLILSVVLCHFLEICHGVPGGRILYKILASFPMPVFLFLLGYFASYRPSRIVKDWIVPYVIFQTLYLLFYRGVLGGEAEIQYTVPYWLLWFMLVGVFYQLLLPLYDLPKGRGKLWFFLLTLAVGILAGWDENIGYFLALSRFFVFQPWFVLGYYLRKNDSLEKLQSAEPWKRRVISAVSVLGVIASMVYIYICKPSEFVLYGSAPYGAESGSVWDRLALMALAGAWIFFLLVALRPILSRKIPLVSRIGRNSLPVYLLHGFVFKLLEHYKPQFLQSFWAPFVLTLALLLLLGQPWLTELLRGRVKPLSKNK